MSAEPKSEELGSDRSSSPQHNNAEKVDPATNIKRSIPIRIFDSFRRDPNQKITAAGEIVDLKLEHGHSDSYDVETAISNTAKSPLARKLKARHLQMIAIGGSIGLFYCPFGIDSSKSIRYWSVCRIRESSRSWRSRLPFDCIQSHQLHALLHSVRPG
jgi:hypothetical protein